MKKFYRIGFLILLAGIFFSGCYTQVAMRDYDRERYGSKQDEEYETYESENDTDYYAEDYDTDEEYYEEDGVTINNYYYGYPGYRRYFWSYYPSISIGVYWGSYFYDPFYYGSFYYDPFYYNYWCVPIYYSYYPFYRFHDYYWGYYPGYYRGYYGGYASIYKERSNDMYRVRNSGLRNGITSRNGITGRNTGSLNRTTLTRDDNGRISTRDRNTEKEIIKRGSRDDEKNTRRGLDSRGGSENKNVVREKNSRDTKKIAPNENTRRKAPEYIERRNKTERESIRKESGDKEKRNTNPKKFVPRKNDSPKKYTPPKKNDAPKNYTPPKRNSTPPQRTYSPPKNSTPQRSTTPPRSSGNTRGGSNDSGRRTR